MNGVRRKRRKKHNRIGMLLISAIVFFMVAVFSFGNFQSLARSQENQKKIEKLEKQLDSEEKRQEELQEREKYMQTKKFIEEYAQEKMGLVYPDEIIFKAQK